MASIEDSINASNLIIQGYSDVDNYYDDIKNGLVYKEIVPDYANITLVDVGCLCNSEYSSFNFNSERYWDSDTVTSNLNNAQKLANDLEWAEQSNMRSGKIKAYQGMVVLTKTAANYIQDDVTYFNDIANTVNSPSRDFNIFTRASGGTGTAIDLFGYFMPDATGTWQFTIPSSNPSINLFTYLWVGDAALYDYKVSNANIKSTTPSQSGGQNTASFSMNKGDCIPFRIQFISKNTSYTSNNGTPFFITPPSNSNAKGVLTTNPGNEWYYFITFMKDNAIYYKNLLYFGLVQSVKDNKKYDCYFINTNKININNFLTYKLNPQLQYFRTEIPTPIMVGRGSLKSKEGNSVKLDFQSGVAITITNATYGVPGGNYNYNACQDVTTVIKKTTPTDTKTDQVNTTDKYIPTEFEMNTIYQYTKSKQTTSKQCTNISTKRTIDVTAKVQKIVDSLGGSKLIINSGSNNFKLIFGNAIEYNGDPEYNSTENTYLTLEYTYKIIDESIITERNLFLDPATALITVGATFFGNKTTTPMSMKTTPTCPSGNCDKYKMGLSNNGNLVVYNSNNNEIGSIELTSYIKNNPNFKVADCQVNPNLLNDPYINTSLNAGTSTILTNGNKIKSPDGRFKLEFDNNKLIFTYCYLPYYKMDNGLKYTTVYNINSTNNAQIFYFYRVNTRGLLGRKFLNETDTSTQTTTLHYIPNSHNNILYQPQDSASFKPMFSNSKYPLMKNGELAFASNYNSNVTGAKTYKDCANQCLSEPNNGCEYFFFLTKNDGTTRCYTDKISDSNPLFSEVNNDSSIKSSTIYKKPYTIKTTCGTVPDGQSLYRQNINGIKQVSIDYRIPENAPNLSYYCSLDKYQESNNTTIGTYSLGNTDNINIYYQDNIEKFTNLRENMDNSNKENKENAENKASATSEEQYGKYSPYEVTHMTKKFPILNKLTQEYSNTQNKIYDQYDQTINYLRQYENSLISVEGPQYKFSGTDSLIPEKFRNDKDSIPNINFMDGAKKDVGIMLMQQNTMYTLASITAATCLILAVAFGGNME